MNHNYPEYLLEVIRAWHGLERFDESRDDEWQQLSPLDAFGIVLDYEGIKGYDSTILMWIADIFKVQLNTRQGF